MNMNQRTRREQVRLQILGLAALLLAAAELSGCGSTSKTHADSLADAPSAAVVKVHRRDLTSKLEIASEFLPYQEVSVYAKVSGYIQKLCVDWGTHVRQGQLLAVLEIPELEHEIQQDEAAVRRSDHDLARAREELNRAHSAYNVAHLTYTRLANVQKTQPDLVAQEEVDVAEGKDLEASAGVSAAKESLAAAEQALLVAKAALDRDKALYDYSRITAPFDGVVTEMDAYTGALLPAGTSSNKGDEPLCHLSQNSLLRLVIPVPERAVAGIRAGQTVVVAVSAVNQTFNGKIVRFSGLVDPDTRTMHTEVDVPNPKYVLIPGMYATVQIPTQKAENVLAVPVQAVSTSGGDHGSVLVVNDEKRIERRDVVLGIQTATTYEIVSGLKENELVLFGEQGQYKPGELVNPKITEPPQAE